MPTDEKLTAANLKKQLWETLLRVREGKMDPKTANAIAGQARGIISTLNVEIQINNSADLLKTNLKEFIK